jgi:pantoate kinase
LLRGAAFTPGHVTGFFSIYDSAKKKRHQGSRGAGICLSLGAHSIVGVTGSSYQQIDVLINNEKISDSVTEYAVRRILGDEPVKVKVVTTLDLPPGQGFGMSAAGALSSSLALDSAMDLGRSRDDIICAAHEAEINYHTGLGDVLPQSVGGVVMRKMEGCPPFGLTHRIEADSMDVVLCVMGDGISTKEIITDEEHKRRITKAGFQCLLQLQKDPNIEKMMQLSYEFSRITGLLTEDMDRAIKAANEVGMASMSMLGESIFALGDTEKLKNALSKFGDVFVCEIDSQGMRLE